jgi:hypothetical protein
VNAQVRDSVIYEFFRWQYCWRHLFACAVEDNSGCFYSSTLLVSNTWKSTKKLIWCLNCANVVVSPGVRRAQSTIVRPQICPHCHAMWDVGHVWWSRKSRISIAINTCEHVCYNLSVALYTNAFWGTRRKTSSYMGYQPEYVNFMRNYG